MRKSALAILICPIAAFAWGSEGHSLIARIAEAQLRQVETQVLTDVEKAYQSYLTAQRALTIYSRDGMHEAARVRQIVSLSYRRGEASLFELLDAQRTASQAAVAANQARANYQLALWQIEQAIGGSLR